MVAVVVTGGKKEDEVDLGVGQLGSVQFGEDSRDFDKRHDATSVRVGAA